MLSRPEACRGCPLDPIASGFSRPDGLGRNQGVLLLGEALGRKEADEGLPFVGEAGYQLKRVLARAGLQRQDFLLWNTVACFPKDTLIQAKGIEKAYRRWYSGPLIRVKTRFNEISGTPNHPVLTRSGWVPLHKLSQGDYLIRTNPSQPMTLSDPYVYNTPTRFEEIFGSLADSDACHGIAGTNMDFHGDGMQTKVQVVSCNGFLWDRVQPLLYQELLDLLLKGPDHGLGSVTTRCSGQGPLMLLLLSLLTPHRCDVGRHGQLLTTDAPNPLQPNPHSVRAGSGGKAVDNEVLLQSSLTNSEPFRQLLDPGSSMVELDEIVQIDQSSFLGHVYNLQTMSGQYTANGYCVSNCRPPNNFLEGAPWEEGAIAHCDVHYRSVIKNWMVRALAQESGRPTVIVPLGGVALKKTLGLEGILDRRAPKRGYVYDYTIDGAHFKVVPTLHPSFLMQGGQNFVGVEINDIQRAVSIAKDGWPPYAPDYILYPTQADAERYVRDARLAVGGEVWLTADIETQASPEKDEEDFDEVLDAEITRISFSYRPGTGITFPWTNEFVPYIQELLLLAAPYIVFWNQAFDVPRLLGKGLRIGPKILDAMWMSHWWQSDIPKGLGFVSSLCTRMPEWKSLGSAGSQPEFYSCCDSDAAISNTYFIRDQLKRDGRWEGFLKHSVEMQPILDGMGQAGVLIDPVKRDAFREAIVSELDVIQKEIQDAVPFGVRPFAHRKKPPSGAVLGGSHTVGGKEFEWDYDRDTGEWGLRGKFLHSSPKQVLAYFRHQQFRIPKNYKTGRDTSSKDEIERLLKDHPKDPVLRKIIEAREHQKLIGQYIDGYEPRPDGRIGTTFDHSPSTWRTASKRPNVQNVIKRNSLAKKYREMFIAQQGYRLVEIDFESMQAVFVGYYAKDNDYIRAAKLGAHGIFASHLLANQGKFDPIDHVKWSDPDIRAAVAEIKLRFPKVYDDAKHAVHGGSFGATPKKLVMDFPESFPTMKYAEFVQDLFFSKMARKVRKWQDEIIDFAAQHCYVDNPFDGRHYFWDALKFAKKNGQWQKVWGSDAKRILAYLPQSSEIAVVEDALLRLWLIEFYCKSLRWILHDSLLLELPYDRLFESRVARVKEEMERPIREMGGLTLGTEVKIGRSWGEMQ